MNVISLADRPNLRVLDGFASEDECERIGGLFAPGGPLADTMGRDASGAVSDVAVSRHPELLAMAERVRRLLGDPGDAETMCKYRVFPVGQAHEPPRPRASTEMPPQRVTAIVYLDTVTDGGELVFPETTNGRVSITPIRGRLVAWDVAFPDGSVEPWCWHQVVPVRDGVARIAAFRLMGDPADVDRMERGEPGSPPAGVRVGRA